MDKIRKFLFPSAILNAVYGLLFALMFLLVSGAFYNPNMAYIAGVFRESIFISVLVNTLIDSLLDFLFNYIEPITKDSIKTKLTVIIVVSILCALLIPYLFSYVVPTHSVWWQP